MQPRLLAALAMLAVSSFSLGARTGAPCTADGEMSVNLDKVFRGCVEKGECGEEVEVAFESARNGARTLRAWRLRDPDLYLADVPADFSYQRPDGVKITRADLFADVKQRMAMTTCIDSFTFEIEVESAKQGKAVVLSRQKWSRMLRQTESPERRRLTSVTHRETWEKVGGVWKSTGFTVHDQVARWEDDPVPNQ